MMKFFSTARVIPVVIILLTLPLIARASGVSSTEVTRGRRLSKTGKGGSKGMGTTSAPSVRSGPSQAPSSLESFTLVPTATSTDSVSSVPTVSPSFVPSDLPSLTPSQAPSTPTTSPVPTSEPTEASSFVPSDAPSLQPSRVSCGGKGGKKSGKKSKSGKGSSKGSSSSLSTSASTKGSSKSMKSGSRKGKKSDRKCIEPDDGKEDAFMTRTSALEANGLRSAGGDSSGAATMVGRSSFLAVVGLCTLAFF